MSEPLSNHAQRWYEAQLANSENSPYALSNSVLCDAFGMYNAQVDRAKKACIKLGLIEPCNDITYGAFKIASTGRVLIPDRRGKHNRPKVEVKDSAWPYPHFQDEPKAVAFKARTVRA
jgi:hypothetical protein